MRVRDFQDEALTIEDFTEKPPYGKFVELFNFCVRFPAHNAQALVAIHPNKFDVGVSQNNLGHLGCHFLPHNLGGNGQSNVVLPALHKYLF